MLVSKKVFPFLAAGFLFGLSNIAHAGDYYTPVNQGPFSSVAPSSIIGERNTNQIYPDKKYIEYAGQLNSGNCQLTNNCVFREPIPYRINGQKGLCDSTGCHYPTNKWFTDLTFRAIFRNNIPEAFLTSTGPYNVRTMDDYLGDGSANSPYIFLPGLSFTTPKVPYLAVAGTSAPTTNNGPSLHNYFTDIYPTTLKSTDEIELGFGIPVGVAKDASYIYRTITHFDQMSLTTRWNIVSDPSHPDSSITGYMESPIVRGSPYMTMTYSNLPVNIFGPTTGFVALACDDSSCTDKTPVNLNTVPRGQVFHGQVFRVFLLTNNRSKAGEATAPMNPLPFYLSEYTLFFSEPVDLRYDRPTDKPPAPVPPFYQNMHYFQTVEADGSTLKPFNGTVRIGHVGDYAETDTSDNRNNIATEHALLMLNHDSKAPADFSQQEKIVNEYANVYPTGADIQLGSNGTGAEITYNWNTSSIAGLNNNNDKLLMTAYNESHIKQDNIQATPGIQVLNDCASNEPNCYQIQSLKGMMYGVVGNTWQLQIPYAATLTDSSLKDRTIWTGPQIKNQKFKNILQSQFEDDLQKIDEKRAFGGLLPEGTNDSYLFGKQIAALARLLLIGEQLGYTSDDKLKSLLTEVETAFDPWLNGKAGSDPSTQNYFVYDPLFGGTITGKASFAPEECSNPNNCGYNSDYYNGQYTDHYFHYGYFLYTAAVLAKMDPAWLAANKEKVNLLARDIANPAVTDGYYTPYRHFDWFEGHAFANGLGPTSVGRNEESTSEALNAWYGLTLWGIASGNNDMRDIGRILTTQEMLTDQVWEQINPNTSIYKDIYANPNTNWNQYPNYKATMKDQVMTGINWQLQLEHTSFFGNFQNYVLGIQMLPYTPITNDYYTSDFVQANMDNFNNAFNLTTSKLDSFVSNPSPQTVLGLFKDEFDKDVSHRATATGGMDAQTYWGFFEGTLKNGYIWSLIVDPIIAVTDYQKAYQIIRFDDQGILTPLMKLVNTNFDAAYQVSKNINPFDPNKVKDTIFPCQSPLDPSNMCIYPDESPSNTQMGNWMVGDFAKLDYRGIDMGQTKSNILWWIAIHAPADVNPLNPPQVSAARDIADNKPQNIVVDYSNVSGGTLPYSYTYNVNGAPWTDFTPKSDSEVILNKVGLGKVSITVTVTDKDNNSATSNPPVEIPAYNNNLTAPNITTAFRRATNGNTVVVNYDQSTGGSGNIQYIATVDTTAWSDAAFPCGNKQCGTDHIVSVVSPNQVYLQKAGGNTLTFTLTAKDKDSGNTAVSSKWVCEPGNGKMCTVIPPARK